VRRALGVAAVWLALVAPVAADGDAADWTVSHRVTLPASGAPVDLAPYVGAGEGPARFAIRGSYSFLHDGSEIDAMSRTVGGRRDVAAGPFVVLPPGAEIVERDPVAHRYVIEAPRASSMPIAFNLVGLATRDLLTVSEARAQLQGAIEVESLTPPPSATERAVVAASQTASGISGLTWAAGALGLAALGLLGFVTTRRRRATVAVLLRRARRARAQIAREVLAIGPAFDPVSASADQLGEAAAQQAAHHASLEAALARTADMGSAEAVARRRALEAKRDEALARLEGLVARLEATATELAGRAADVTRASGVERLVANLGADLEAAVEAEEELARV